MVKMFLIRKRKEWGNTVAAIPHCLRDNFIDVNYVLQITPTTCKPYDKPATTTYGGMMWLLRILLISLQGTHPVY
jgi:hypothetical protein